MSRQSLFYCAVAAATCLLSLTFGCGDDARPTAPSPDVGVDADEADVVTEPDVEDVGPDTPLTEQGQIMAVPETTTWDLAGLTDEVQIVRTEGNIPHIFATNRLDLGFAMGFVVAQDRFFIMDLQRRLALGTLSGLLGDMLLGADLESRLTGMSAVNDKLIDSLSDDDAAYLEAYAAGVNAYLERVQAGELPPPSEYDLVGFLFEGGTLGAMKPFDLRSVMAMVTVIFYMTNFDGRDVARQARADALDTIFDGAELGELRRAGARTDVWDRVDPLFDVSSAPGFGITVNGAAQKRAGVRRSASRVSPAPRSPLPSGLMERAMARLEHRKNLLGRKEDGNFGSNAWAVDGAHSRGGEALVAGDGHLPFMIPPIMYQVGINTELLGGGDIHQAGLMIAALPLVAVGTNGHIAWSQVNPESDITDWYREEIQLDTDGLPSAALFEGQWRPLSRVDETYEIADIPLLNSVGRTETLSRWVTVDGRMLFDVEGRVLGVDEEPAAGEHVVVLPSVRVVPGDTDGDGVISAITFDYTGFDASQYVRANLDFGLATDVRGYQAATRGLVGNMLFSAVVDQAGDALYTSYQAVPCRTYLPRDAEGHWIDGANPTQLIDGTTYPSFTIPTDAVGHVDEGPGQTDPTLCVVPFDETPQAIDPPQGYVVTANNQPAPVTADGTLDDAPWHLGGPWASIRANTISGELQKAVEDGTADVDKMAEIQANNRSRLGELFSPALVEAVAAAKAASTGADLEPYQDRLAALYASDPDLDEAVERLAEWAEGGFRTPSGVETFYHHPTEGDLRDSVATMLFNAWLPRALDATFGDEGMEAAWRFDFNRSRLWAFLRFLRGRGVDNPGALASWNEATLESVFFDVRGTPEVEHSEEVFIAALIDTLNFLRSEPLDAATGGFGTSDMSTWLWGLRHQVRFESPVADYLPAEAGLAIITDVIALTTKKLPLADTLGDDDPRRGLKWFPRGGDNYTVDVAGPGFTGTEFSFGYGPQMRMVIALKDGQVWGQNIIPGGQSGLVNSPFFYDQAAKWLANETLPLRFHTADVVAGATGREVLRPR